MSKMLNWTPARASSERIGTSSMRSGSTGVFNCCGASYRSFNRRTNMDTLKNTHGVLIIKGQIGTPVSNPYGHTIQHVHTRAGVLTLSLMEKQYGDRNQITRIPGNLV